MLLLANGGLTYNSAQAFTRDDSGLGFSLFTRRYWGNRCYFLFHRLVICLSSAGRPARSQVQIDGDFQSPVLCSSRPLTKLPARAPAVSNLVRGQWAARSGPRGSKTQLSLARRGSCCHPESQRPLREERDRLFKTLRRTWPQDCPRPQFAFRMSMLNVSCNSHYFSQIAASFIDARAE